MTLLGGAHLAGQSERTDVGDDVGELVDALVRVLEYMVQGALAVFLGAYVLAWVHKFKNWVYEHVSELTEYMVGPNWRTLKPHPYVQLAIVLGGLYFIGVVTNAVGYWVLRPAHEIVISAAITRPKQRPAEPIHAAALVQVVLQRVLTGSSPPEKAEYVAYILDEVSWRNHNLEAMKHALDPLVKQSRIIRGTVVIACGFLIVSLLKAVSFLLSMAVLAVPPLHQVGETLFRNLVSPRKDDNYADRDVRERIRSMRAIAGRFAVSNLIYSVAALLVFWSSMGAYATLEREYHIMAQSGAESALVAKPSQDGRTSR
jgi:hypothetical protein